MSTPLRPPDADDGLDPRFDGLVEVAPLDEVTRARLVRTALAGADEQAPDGEGGQGPERPPARKPLARILAVAAALLVVLVVGLAVLVPRGSDDSRPTALDVPSDSAKRAGPTAPLTPDASAAPTAEAAPSAGSESAVLDAPSASLALPSLGDLGDVSNATRLARAASARLTRPFDATTVTVSGCAASAGNAFGTPVAAGTGTIDGRRAVVVVVAAQPAGSRAVVAVRGRSCGRAVSAVLP